MQTQPELPWTASGYRWIYDAVLVPALKLANSKEGELSYEWCDIRNKLVQALSGIMEDPDSRGLFPGGPDLFSLPLVFLFTKREHRKERGRITWGARMLRLKRDQVDKETTDRIWGVVALLKSDETMNRLLRRCHQCERFFFASGDHRRGHTFCEEACRRAFDVLHRDRARVAAYMRRYRAALRKRRKRTPRK